MQEGKSIWNSAAVPGAVLGGVCIAYQLAGLLLTKTDAPVLAGLVSTLLWLAKFIGCIWLMHFFMKKFAAADPDVDNSDTFKFGVVTALFSALIYSAFYFAYAQFIAPDMFDEAFSMISESYSTFMTEDMLEQVENIKPDMPKILFFSSLLYCFIYGTVLSAILSRKVPSANPFE